MQIKDNIFRRQFHARELYDWFHTNFPESFCIEIYKGDTPEKADWDKRIWNIRDNGYRKFYNPKYRTEYTLCDRAIMHVSSGDENTYLRFLIEDDKGNGFTVTWGYKRYEVPGDYVAALAALIFDTCYHWEHHPHDRFDFCIVSLKEYYIKQNQLELTANS